MDKEDIDRDERSAWSEASDAAQATKGRSALAEHHLNALRDRSITEDWALKAQLATYWTAEEGARALGLDDTAHRPPAPGIIINYPGSAGYAKLRPDDPRIPNPEHAKIHGSAVDFMKELPPTFIEGPKVISPRKASRVYFPLGPDDPLFKGANVIWICESEFKALALRQAGIPAIGVPGVDGGGDAASRRYAKAQGQNLRLLHPDLLRLGVSDRRFIICFDSDVDTNPDILAALWRLGRMLVDAGAEPFVAYVPRRDGFKSTGVDDHLAKPLSKEERRCGMSRVGELEASVRPFNVQDVLDWLAEHWEDWGSKVRDRELTRAARLARLVFTQSFDFDHWCRDAKEKLVGVTIKHLRDLAPKPEQTEKEPFNARQYMESWVERKRVIYNYGSEGFTLGGEQMTAESLVAELELDAEADDVGLHHRTLGNLLTRWLDRQDQQVLDTYRAKLACRPGDDRALRTWLRAVTGREDQVDLAAMWHFIWQVKRKLFRLKVERHMMNVLHGRQDGGKTEAIRKLLTPVTELTDPISDMRVLTDERSHFRMYRNYVTFCDEMAKAERADVDQLKHLITEVTLRWRIMKMNRAATRPNNTTFIGASNVPIQDLIRDPTGMRRFYQIDCLEHLDWDAINAIEPLGIWISVDERLEFKDTPLAIPHVLAECKRRQESLRTKSALEEWFELYCVVDLERGRTSAMAAFEAFSEWVQRSRRPVWTVAKFGRDLKKILDDRYGLESAYTKSSSTVYFFRVANPKDEANRARTDDLLREAATKKGAKKQ